MNGFVKSIDPLADAGWPTLIEQSGAGLFHSRPWLLALRECYAFDIKAYACDDGSMVPFCEIDDILGRRLVVLPFSDACDPVGPSVDVILRRLQSHGLPLQMRVLERRLNMTITKKARWHRLALPATDWNPSFVRCVRKAQRAGVEVRPLENLQDFADLHVVLRKEKFRLLAQPAKFFAAIHRHFAACDSWHALGAWHKNKLIAATIYLSHGDTMYYKYNASDQQHLMLRPNNLLIWAGVELAVSRGLRTLDLGPSDDDQPGLIRFKRATGALELELQFLQWLPPGWEEGNLPQVRAMLQEMTKLLTDPRVPNQVTADAGAALYRYFA